MVKGGDHLMLGIRGDELLKKVLTIAVPSGIPNERARYVDTTISIGPRHAQGNLVLSVCLNV